VVQQKNGFTARLRAAIEEELGSFRQFADAPSVEIEELADRLVRALEPLVAADGRVPESFAA
jgi:hypothetical protein